MRRVSLIAALALLGTDGAGAGRPLSTDDAATADAGTCQLETWLDRGRDDRALVFAPACGLARGLELGAEFAPLHPQDVLRTTAGLGLKWAPPGWRIDASLGALNFGLKLAGNFEQPAGAAWRHGQTTFLALASWQPAGPWAVHANLGNIREHTIGSRATLLNLALAWTPDARSQLFAEVQSNDQRAVFGGAVRSAGGRWWLLKDRFGLDLTVSHEAGADKGVRWSLGFGWYGLGL